MQISMPDRRCLNLFKIFVEKVFIPQIKHINGSLAEWNVFQSLISAPNPNLNDLQNYVDSLGGKGEHPPQKNQKANLSKKQQEIEQIAREISQLNKTFGGERCRIRFAELTEEINPNPHRESNHEQPPHKLPNTPSTSGIITDLSRLVKTFEEHQVILTRMTSEIVGPVKQSSSRSALNNLNYNNLVPAFYSPQPYVSLGSATKTASPNFFRNLT